MANLFELMSDTQRSCEAEIKKCSVILRRTCAIRESVDRASAEHTEAVGTEKGVSTSREFSVTSQWNNLRLDDARTRSDPMEHIGANSEELTWTEGPQRVSSFTIPKKRRENKDLLVDLPLTSRECQKEVLPTLVESYQHPSSQGAFSYTEVKSVNNKGLLNKFLEKRRELRQMGYSDKELLDSYAFLYARTAKEVETICRNGVHVGNSCVSCLGHPEMGVQLCRYSDVLKQEPFQYSQTGHIIIFKVMKGKIKTVTENRSSVYLEPTPNYDCHISKSILTESTTVSPGREYESTQIYLYEYGDLEVLPCPRHICPVFVAKFTYIRRELKHSSKYMYVTPSTRSAICHSASSRMSGSQVQTTTTTTSISSLPSPCGPTISSGIPSSCISTWTPQPATTKGDENGTVVWNGKLCLMGDLHCLVDLVSRSSNLKPAHLGTAIDIRMRMKRDTARAKFLSQVKSLRRNADVFTNSQYYSVCHLKPTADNFISRFQAVVKYLCKMDSVGVLHDGAMNLLLIMPAGKLTEELGLFQDGDANLQLCCVFISPKPRRQVLRNIRAERSIGHLQASENIAVTQDLPPAQMIRHLVSWCPGEEKGTKVQNLSLPDYDRGFQTTFPQNSLISRPLLHDLFVEQILIQRQHNSVTGVLHVPSKLYGEKSNIGSVVKPKMNTPKVCMPEVTAGVWNKKTVLHEEEVSKQKVCDSGSIVCIDFNGPSCEMSPTMISPDTTFPDHDPKVNPLGTLKVIEHTLEDTVSSTVSDLNTSVSPDTLTDELAEQIVRGYRPSSHRVNADHKKVNLRDPRKRKLLETLTKVASGQHSAMETDTAKKSCYNQGHVELNSKKDTLLPVTSSVSAMENTPSVSDTDLASFSPEPSDGKQENSAYEINIVKKIPSEQLVQKTSLASDQTQKKQVEPDIVITALGMKQLLDSDLEDPSLKVNDGSEDEFEEPTPEEISDALDRRLLMDSLKQSIKSSKTSGPILITPGLRVTIKKKADSSVISSATDMKSFLNLNVSCVDSVETPTGLREVPGGIAKAVSAAQDQSKPPLFVQGTPIKPKGDTVNIIRTEDSPVGVLRDESKLKASAKSPVLWKDKTFCLELLKKPTPKEVIQEDCLQANKQSRNSVPPLDDKKMGVSDFVNSVIHTRGLPDTSDRHIELTEKISLEKCRFTEG
ncbi:uncharacterized protein LOC135471974 isoform X2 [Liolophura sinensis]|uniref:uncharacterized protein LOC135471974 isoform X2 n=1 Tax=Liolophura sinensis TaxID=3198878 RepID=UPI0031588086